MHVFIRTRQQSLFLRLRLNFLVSQTEMMCSSWAAVIFCNDSLIILTALRMKPWIHGAKACLCFCLSSLMRDVRQWSGKKGVQPQTEGRGADEATVNTLCAALSCAAEAWLWWAATSGRTLCHWHRAHSRQVLMRACPLGPRATSWVTSSASRLSERSWRRLFTGKHSSYADGRVEIAAASCRRNVL